MNKEQKQIIKNWRQQLNAERAARRARSTDPDQWPEGPSSKLQAPSFKRHEKDTIK